MKQLGRGDRHSYIVEFTLEEMQAFQRLKEAAEGKVMNRFPHDLLQSWQESDLAPLFATIYEWITLTDVVNMLEEEVNSLRYILGFGAGEVQEVGETQEANDA
jgi:hypothetical protein